MIFSTKSSINVFLMKVQHATRLVLTDAAIQGGLARFGYDLARFQAGEVLLTQAQAAQLAALQARREQVAATEALKAAQKVAKARYQIHITAARRALGDERTAAALLQPAAHRYVYWQMQTYNFYVGLLANPTYLRKLAAFGVQVAELNQGLQLVEAVATAKMVQTQRRQEYRLAMQTRTLKLAELKIWFDELIQVARIAFAYQPALLEALTALPGRLNSPKNHAEESVLTYSI